MEPDEFALLSVRRRKGRGSNSIRDEIAGQMSIQRSHRCLVGGCGPEPDEAVGPHQDGATLRHTRSYRIEPGACRIDDRNKIAPARAQSIQATRLAEHDQMVAGTAKSVTGWEPQPWAGPSNIAPA